MNTSYKQLTRSRTNRVVAGLCAGLGTYFGIDPVLVRLLFVLGFFLGGHFGIILLYIIMALIIPEEPMQQPIQ